MPKISRQEAKGAWKLNLDKKETKDKSNGGFALTVRTSRGAPNVQIEVHAGADQKSWQPIKPDATEALSNDPRYKVKVKPAGTPAISTG